MNSPRPTEDTCLKNLTVPYYLDLASVKALLTEHLSQFDQHLLKIWKAALQLSQLTPTPNLSILADLLNENNPCFYTRDTERKQYREGLKRLLAVHLLGLNSHELVRNNLVTPKGDYLTMRTYEGLYFLNEYNWEDGLDLLMFYSYITK